MCSDGVAAVYTGVAERKGQRALVYFCVSSMLEVLFCSCGEMLPWQAMPLLGGGYTCYPPV
jgi:hypothetical protein